MRRGFLKVTKQVYPAFLSSNLLEKIYILMYNKKANSIIMEVISHDQKGIPGTLF